MTSADPEALLVGGRAMKKPCPHVVWALRQRGLNPSARLVLIYLADKAHGITMECWRSLPTIAGDLEISPRTVHAAVHLLAERKLIEIEVKARTANHYRVLRPKDGEDDLADIASEQERVENVSLANFARKPIETTGATDARIASKDPGQPCKLPQNNLATVARESLKRESLKEESPKEERLSPPGAAIPPVIDGTVRELFPEASGETAVAPTAKGKHQKRTTEVNTPAGAHPEFERFYGLYPRKVTGKGPASVAFNKAIASGADPEAIIAGLLTYPFKSDPEFQPHVTTWLNQGRWAHEPTTAPPTVVVSKPTSAYQARGEAYSDLADRFEGYARNGSSLRRGAL